MLKRTAFSSVEAHVLSTFKVAFIDLDSSFLNLTIYNSSSQPGQLPQVGHPILSSHVVYCYCMLPGLGY